jgi:hypothetical protein
MIVYNVTVNIDGAVEKEWLQWMKEVHIPEVLATGLFIENRIMRIFDEEKMEDTATYAFQYVLKNMDDFDTYQEKFAPTLQKSHSERYKDRFVAFRTLMEMV